MVRRVDQRLAALGTDYIDLLFFHGLNSRQVDWPNSKEMQQSVDAIKKTGKVRFMGFTTHDAKRPEQLMAAAEGGFVDVIMLQFSPWLEKDAPLYKALDACHKVNIGLVSMKQMAGHTQALDRLPVLKERGLNSYQGLLTAIWSDERIASTCVTMMNTDHVTQNTDAAARFEPLKQAEIDQLRDALLAAGPMMCADCDGRCSRTAGTKARLGDLTRFLTYHEHHGSRRQAREGYAELTSEERNWQGADLEAAREACPSKLDFASLLPEVDRLLG
jgi:predicted aldo/keto reductase-like oxidoreductase